MNLRPVLTVFVAALFTAATAHAGLRTVAKIGDPAADFPPGMIYWDVKNPVIGARGHVAFFGAADTSVGATGANTAAVWSGRPGQLSTVIKEGESPSGFPASVVFDFAYTNDLIVTDNGSIAFQAYMKGSRTGRAYLAAVDGTTHGILQVGMPAPGYGPGVNITALHNMAFSDAGMAIWASTNSVANTLYFWDNNTVELALVLGQSLAPVLPDCVLFQLAPPRLTQAGDLLFLAQTLPGVAGADCPTNALLVWNNGVLRKVVATGDPVPDMPIGTVFDALSYPQGASINDAGDVTFSARMYNAGETVKWVSSVWVKRKNGVLEPVALHQEAVPGRPSELLAINYNGTLPRSNASRRTAIWSYTTANAHLILAGQPKAGASYASFDDVGTSHLDVLVHADDPPPGFGATWYLDTVYNPVINNRGSIAFTAIAKDALNPFTSATAGLWLGDDRNNVDLIAALGATLRVDGMDQTLSNLGSIVQAETSGLPGTSNDGRPVQLSDNGQMVFMGALSGSYPDTLFITEACPRATMNRDFGGDCKADILFRNAATGKLALWEMDGRLKTPSNAGGQPNAWRVDGIGDFGGDGRADILLRHKTKGVLKLWEMDGNAHKQLKIGDLNPLWEVAGIGDFGGDGNADILLRHKNTGMLQLWEMSRNKKTTSVVGPLSLQWRIDGIGDFDGNGTDDILLRHTKSGDLVLWTMEGNVATSSAIGPLKRVWLVVGVGDFRGDGRADILLRHKKTGLLKLWEMNGTAATESNIGGLNPVWDVVQVSDFGGDGNADILLRHTTTGQVKVWEMDGNARTAGSVGKRDLAWAVQ